MSTDKTSERKALAKFVEEAIEKGATTVEDVHKSIADLPLKILEESELLRRSAKEVRRVQDHTIGAIYDLIRHINQQVGTLASDLLDKAAKRRHAEGHPANVRCSPIPNLPASSLDAFRFYHVERLTQSFPR